MQDEAGSDQGGNIRSAAKRKALAFLCAIMAVVATVCYTIGMINAAGPRSMTFVALFMVLAIYFLYKGIRLYTAVDEQEHARQMGASGGPVETTPPPPPSPFTGSSPPSAGNDQTKEAESGSYLKPETDNS